MLDVKAEGYMTQSLRQLLPQQNLFQVGGGSVLLEGDEDRFSSRLGSVRRLLGVRQCDGPSRLWRVDGVGGRRWLPRALHVSRSARGV